MKPTNIKNLQNQSRNLTVRQVDYRTYVVESKSHPRGQHIVTVTFGPDKKTVHTRCTCEWALYRGVACSHVMAALEYMASLKERTLSFWPSLEDARRQKNRTFFLPGSQQNDGVWITSRSA